MHAAYKRIILFEEFISKCRQKSKVSLPEVFTKESNSAQQLERNSILYLSGVSKKGHH